MDTTIDIGRAPAGGAIASKARFARFTEHRGIGMSLIGYWADLAGYYAGTDGNAWSYACGGWSNCGELASFRANFSRRYRGELF